MASYSYNDIMKMEQRYRSTLLNSLSGFKNVHLIGTVGLRGETNLGIFSSIVHIGANPPHLGFIMRPLTVPRGTYHNIKAKKHFTINHVSEDFLKKAHQTSANYPWRVSEFTECGLTEEYSENIVAPYVKESQVKLGLEFVEEHHIKANGTIFVVGKVLEVHLPEELITKDGYFPAAEAGSLACNGLDAYYKPERITRLAYVRPGQEVKEIKI